MTSNNANTSIATETSAYQVLPSVSAIIEQLSDDATVTLSGELLTTAISEAIAVVRDQIAAGERPTRNQAITSVINQLGRWNQPRLRPVINATGVIIHTNLGRSMVSAETAAAMAQAAASNVALELDPDTNERGGRMSEISALLRLLTGAELALVVNNNAAAVLLVLSAVAAGRNVILSRGEAVEIGGGFRVPDVLRQSGATLVEVGTTNRTYAREYERAIDDQTAALLKVHPSNFRISGFVHSAAASELAEIGRARHIPLIEDLGSGALLETERFGLAPEPTIRASLEAGTAIVTASGDKLLGGPQAGLILGSRYWIELIERHPLARAVRADKTSLAGVAATLRHYANGEAVDKIPVWRMIATEAGAIRERGKALVREFRDPRISIKEVRSTVGGGSLPGQELPSWAIAVQVENPDDLARRLRIGSPAVFGRVEDQQVLLDLRSVLPEQDGDLKVGLKLALDSSASG